MSLSRHLRFARGFLFVSACLVCALPSRAAETDEQIIATFKAESQRLQNEIHKAGDDMAKVSALQKQFQTLMAEVMTKVSPKGRAALEVGMKVINPIMEGGIAYTGTVQKYMEAGVFDYTSATSTEIIDRRLGQISEIEKLNDILIKRLASLDTDLEAVLKDSKLSSGEKAAFIRGFQSSTGSRMGAIRAVRNLDARLYTEVRGVYGQLREQMGKWSVKDGQLSFNDDAQVAAYNARMESINVIAQRQEVAQRKALGVK